MGNNGLKEKWSAFWAKQKKKSQDEKAEFSAETEVLKKNEAYYKETVGAQKALKEETGAAPEGSQLSCQHLTKIYSNRIEAVHDFNLEVKQGEFIVLVGPSGCGKSTTLRMIAGLEDITYGKMYIDGVLSNDLTPLERGVAMVFQSYALYPHMSVYKNMAFGLSGLPKEEIDARIKEASEVLEITQYLDRKPTALSGGQCQRVALGRALVRKSKILLLDEPLSNLDAKLRVQMRSELVKLHDTLKNTMIYVTHDQTEAMTMADRIVVLKDGLIMQVGTPREIYDKPASIFVATFIGNPTMNILKGHYKAGKITISPECVVDLGKEGKAAVENFYKNEIARLESAKKELLSKEEKWKSLKENKQVSSDLPIHFEDEKAKIEADIAKVSEFTKEMSGEISFGIRPEDVSIDERGPYAANLDVTELLGAEYYVHVKMGKESLIAKVPTDTYAFKESGKVKLVFNKEKVHVFDPYSGKRIY